MPLGSEPFFRKIRVLVGSVDAVLCILKVLAEEDGRGVVQIFRVNSVLDVQDVLCY